MYEICFGDFETLGLLDLRKCGAYAYANHPDTDASVFGWVFDDNPFGNIWSPEWAWGQVQVPDDPQHIELVLEHVRRGGYMVFWNAFFDRHIWNDVMVPKYGWPYLPLEQVFCAQAQAEANNLPGKLEKACDALGTHYKKDPKGVRLIQQLSVGMTRDTWDSETFEALDKMGHFRNYCLSDVLSTRDVWDYTRPLTVPEWAEYHASERINDRGVAVDADFARAAAKYAIAETKDINEQLEQITGDPKCTVTNHVRKARYLYDQLWPDPELQNLTVRPPKDDKERYSCDRSTRDAVLELIHQPKHAERFGDEQRNNIVEFIEAVEAGNSAAVRKYEAIANYAVADGRVHGCYSFNGAGQTGRYSSRGVQVHNLIRDPVAKGDPNRAIDAIEDIIDGAEPEALVDNYGFPVSRLLARLLRPTFVAGEGHVLVWADYDQIEGRALPWLSDSPGGDAKLDLYRQGVDVYSVTASEITGQPLSQIDDAVRQAMGKVPELALGFGGASGAFAAMGRNYGVVLPESQVKEIVAEWRIANDWCVQFWYQLWDAAMSAFGDPGNWYPAGRVKYMYHPALMRGTLICELPDGRWLVYPQFKHERVIEEDDDGNERIRWRTSYVKGIGSGYARVDLWYGVLAENITQGIAASFLRRALAEFEIYESCVLHTHDEIVLEVAEKWAIETAETLHAAMTDLPDWADGLPISVSVESGPYYTK